MNSRSCHLESNNIHPDYPALMSDERYTDWNPACELNNKLIRKSGIQTNYQYRQYMIKNGLKVQQNNLNAAYEQCGGRKFEPDFKSFHTTKYLFKSYQDKTRPYGYETSDLKDIYLSRQELQSRMIAPLLSQQNYLSMPNSN